LKQCQGYRSGGTRLCFQTSLERRERLAQIVHIPLPH
jgi:hypothetical protein